jgi:hypothetical protein
MAKGHFIQKIIIPILMGGKDLQSLYFKLATPHFVISTTEVEPPQSSKMILQQWLQNISN